MSRDRQTISLQTAEKIITWSGDRLHWLAAGLTVSLLPNTCPQLVVFVTKTVSANC